MEWRGAQDAEEAGFVGFKTVDELQRDVSPLPAGPGVYLVLRESTAGVDFLRTGTGGFFKGKDPNVAEDVLAAEWVEGAPVVYVGKASSLRTRLRQYVLFGLGQNIGHWGGRYIWQLADASQLVIAWKETPSDDPRVVEQALIADFVDVHGRRPFANLRD